MNKPSVRLQVVKGPTGLCVYLNDYRLGGDKPWGGGIVAASWEVTLTDLRRALRGVARVVQNKVQAG